MNVASNASAEVGLELFRSLSAVTARTDNVFISTYGILSALSMLLLGTKGTSEKELLSLLKIKKNGLDAYHESLSRLATSLASPTLSSANRLFIQRNFSLIASFVANSERLYSSAAENVDFAGSPDAAQARINEWVKEKTRDKIPQLLSEPLDPLTVVFLVNAVHFKAGWLYPFKPEHTFSGTFHVTPDESVKCDMMMLDNAQEIRHGNSDRLDCQMVELPYQGDYSMLILMPFVPETLPDVENKLTGQLLREEMKNLRNSPGSPPDIFLPKFNIEFEADLKATLESLGVASLFDRNAANLTGMIDNSGNNVAVSKVIHKAVIEVNEEGTEAAAATGIGYVNFCMPPSYRMDHPFLFVIVHRPTETPIFVGRLSRPPPATVSSEQ